MFQKFFASLLTYAIGFQLMVGAIPNTPVSWVAYGQSCGSGLQWNSTVGRCLSTEQAAKFKEASQTCEKLGSDLEKKNCYKDIVDGKLSEAGKGEAGKVNMSMAAMIMPMASLASAAMFLWGGGPADCPGASSAYLMMGGALAVIAGEIMSGMTYKKKIKAAQEKFEKVTESANGTNAAGNQSDIANSTSSQAEAFQAMIEMEEAVIAAAKTKNNLYMVATAAYAIAAVLSAFETVQYAKAQALKASAYGSAAGIALEKSITCMKASTSYQKNPFLNKNQVQQYALVPQNGAKEIDEKNQFDLVEAFVTNYFEKNQRVSFKNYTSSHNLESAWDFSSLSVISKDLVSLKSGKAVGSTLEDHQLMKEIIDNQFSVNQDQFNIIKIGSMLAQNFTIPNAHAMGDSIGMLAGAAGVGALALWGPGKGFKALYMTPMSRLVLSGIMTVNNVFMIKKTNSEKKKAEDRKKFIENLKLQVLDAGNAFGCSSTDRNSNLDRPECYCYQDGGTLNPSRSKSKTCAAYFGGKPELSGNSNNSLAASSSKTCMTKSGAFDEKCSCKTSNTCATFNSRISASNVPGSTNLLGGLPTTLDGLNSGSLSAQDVNATDMTKLAARANSINEKLLNDPKNKKLALQAQKAKADGEKIMRDMQAQIASSNPGLASTSSDRSSSFLGSTNPSDALDKMKADLKQDIKGYEGGVVNMNSGAGAAKRDEFSLDGLNAGGVTIADEGLENQEKLDEIMAAQYEMGDSEINSDPGANIFQILTNRYQRSGMRRLFGAEKVVPADKPVETPIAQ